MRTYISPADRNEAAIRGRRSPARRSARAEAPNVSSGRSPADAC